MNIQKFVNQEQLQVAQAIPPGQQMLESQSFNPETSLIFQRRPFLNRSKIDNLEH